MKWFQKIALAYLIACVFYGWGLATVAYHVFPYRFLAPPVESVLALIRQQREQGGRAADALQLKSQERRNGSGREGLIRYEPDFKDDGFLLISRFSRPHDQVIVELLSLSDGKVLHTWVPDIKEVLRRTPRHQSELNNWSDHRAQHPLLLPGGDLIIKNSEGPMARVRPDGSVVWTLDLHFHHSLELDAEGNIVALMNSEPPLHGMPSLYQFRDDGISWVSPDGKLLKARSIMDLLLAAGRRDLVFGVGPWEPDRFHINDADPVLHDQGIARRGDIALSIRNVSTVALYRPSEERLVWVRTGPWLGQHDISVLPDGRYSIFGNDVIRFSDRVQEYANTNGCAEVYVLDATTGAVETPYSRVLNEYKVRSKTQGRARILKNGDVFVEATDTFRLLRLSHKTLRWEYFPVSAPGVLGAVHWSRYLTPEEVDLTFLSKNPQQEHQR